MLGLFPYGVKRATSFPRFGGCLQRVLLCQRSVRCFTPSRLTLNDETTEGQSAVSVSLFKNPIVHQLWTTRQKAKQDLRGVTSDRCAVTKTPSDSRVEVSYNFSTDALLWESYRNPWNQMRLGKLLEDLDALAGNIAFFHVHTENRADEDYPVIVTASVDRIHLHQRPSQGSDQKLSGEVTWTGTSSMEIRMQCTDAGSDKEWLEAFVTFVTLDPNTKRPLRIPAIVPGTPREKKMFDAGSLRAAAKKKRRKQRAGTNDAIETRATSLLKEAGPLLTMPSLADPNSILLKDTALSNAMIAQPQVQNLHHRIFGGFLVRRAFELAFSNAYLFGGVRPIFLEVDEVSFASPVDVGDLLVFKSRILYTEPKAGQMKDFYRSSSENESENDTPTTTTAPVALLHIEVEAWVTEPEEVTARLSNQFYFTFAVVQDEQKPCVRKVLPSNIDEARRVAMRMAVDVEQSKQ